MDISAYNFDYLQPPSQVKKVFHDADYVKTGHGKSAKRRIFHGVKFDEFEKEIIRSFENSLHSKDVKLPKSWNASETLKYLYSADFDFSLATSMIETCLKWREDPRSSTLTKEVLQMLSTGVVYIWGTDFDYRPTLIINLNKINPEEKASEDVFKSALSICMDILRSYCFVAGKVENWNIILDVQNTSLIELIKIQSIMQHIQCCFPQTLEKLFIINISDKQWKIIEPMVGHELNETVFLLKTKEVFKITAYLAPHCLEVKYGGKTPTLQKYWPPPDHNGRSTDSRIISNTPKAGDNSAPSSQNRFDTSYSSQERTTASTTNQPSTLNDPFRADKLKPPPKKQLDSPEAGSKGAGYASNVNNSSYQGAGSQRGFDEGENLLKPKPMNLHQRGASAKAMLPSGQDQHHDPDEQLVRGLLFKKETSNEQFKKSVSDRKINQSPPNKVRRVNNNNSEVADWNYRPKDSSSSPSKRQPKNQQEADRRSGYSPFGQGGDWDNDVRRQSEPVYIGRDSEGRVDSPKKSVTFKSEILDHEHEHDNVGTPGSNRSPSGKSNLRTSSKFIVIEKEEQPKKRLIELPRESSDDDNDDSDDSGYFCGICVSSRGKKN